MKAVDFVLLALIALALGFSLFFVIRNKKKGKGCCGSCSGCAGCKNCSAFEQKSK